MSFWYVVVDAGAQKCYINRDMDLCDDFDDVLRFGSQDEATDFIVAHHLVGKARVLFYQRDNGSAK